MTNRLPKVSIIILIALVIISYGLLVVFNIYSQPKLGDSNVSAYMNNVITSRTDKQGKTEFTMKSEQVQYLRQKNIVIASHPHVVLHLKGNKKSTVNIEADNAINYMHHAQVYLVGNVKIQRSKTKSLPQTTFLTNSLTINPDQHVAFTDDNVTIIQPKNKVSSKGLHINLKTGVINLLSQTSGEISPST